MLNCPYKSESLTQKLREVVAEFYRKERHRLDVFENLLDDGIAKLEKIPNAYRIAPSPTGYVHLGTIAMALINQALARQNGGTFYLRIEDTDTKRYVPDAVEKMMQVFDYFGFKFDAVYVQSERRDIYRHYADKLLAEGKAYYCFCTEDDLARMRAKQKAKGQPTGYCGKDSPCKQLTPAQIRYRLKRGDAYVIRANFGDSLWGGYGDDLLSDGTLRPDAKRRMAMDDAVRGIIELEPQTMDPVIIKSDGLPTYAFAHVVDDTLMNTGLVVRGEEWIMSTVQHLQLCELLNTPRMFYMHLPTISIEENGKKRKLSKRKDPEALVTNLIDAGYPKDAILEYLMTIYNTDFEQWRTDHPTQPLSEFIFRPEKVSTNNPLFDLAKLNDIAKNVFARMSHAEIVAAFNQWSWANLPGINPTVKQRIEAMFNVERGGERPRKDLIKFSDIPDLYSYLFDKIEVPADQIQPDIVTRYAAIYDPHDDKDTWWQKIKAMTDDKKELRNIAANIRLAVTGKTNTPDLWAICQILGGDVVKARLLQWSKLSPAAPHNAE